MYVRNCTVPRIMIYTVSYNNEGKSAPTIPILRDFVFENLNLTGIFLDEEMQLQNCPVISLFGFKEKEHNLKNVTFRNIQIYRNGTNQSLFEMDYIRNVSFENINIIWGEEWKL